MPYWHIDTGMAALLILQTAVDEGLGACFFGIPPERIDAFREEFGVPASTRRSAPSPSATAPTTPARRARRDPARGDRRRTSSTAAAGARAVTPPQSIGRPAPGQRPRAAGDLGSETR